MRKISLAGIPWPKPTITLRKTDVRKDGGKYITSIEVATDVFARLGHLVYPVDSIKAWFADNFFDLPAGNAHLVEVQSARPLDLKKIKTGHWLTEW